MKYLLCSFRVNVLKVPNYLIQKLKLFKVFLLNSRKECFLTSLNLKQTDLMRSLTSFVLRAKYTELGAFYMKI